MLNCNIRITLLIITILTKMRFYLICLVAIFPFTCVFSQSEVDSLNTVAMQLYKSNPQQAVSILEKALELSKQENNRSLIGKSKNNLGIILRDLGEFEKAKILSQEALFLVSDSIIVASANNNLGAVSRSLGLYEKALEYYIKASKIYDAKNLHKELATVNNNIGMVYSYLNLEQKAFEYHERAKVIFEKINDQKGLSEVQNNMAILYANAGDLYKALELFKQSLKIEKALNDKKGIAESTNNVGAVYYYLQEIDSSLKYFKASIAIEKSINNLSGLGASFNNIAQILLENNRLDEAKIYLDSAYQYARSTKTAVDIETALNGYATYYEEKNDSKNALKYFKQYAAIKDSILNIETNSKVLLLETEYDTEKKERQILSQRAELAEKELVLIKKNYYIYALITLALVLIFLGYLFYNQQKLKNQQLQKENDLKDALLVIETQNRLQEQRLQISRDLHDNIGAQLTFIISSIDNLKYGFQLPEKLNSKLETISEFTTSTIYQLRDTIWAMNKSEITFEDLQSRISNFMDKANSSTDQIWFNFNVDVDLNNKLTFNSVEGMNIYRIIQEAINNALKYAKANTINVQFKKESNQLFISIVDDGVGFNPAIVEEGNGLKNMKKRAHDIDGHIIIQSEISKGTFVQLQLTLKAENTANDV